MKCPECSSTQIYVTQTRQDTDSTTVRYKRCKSCSHKFFTVESFCNARYDWHKDIYSRIPKVIIREPFTPSEKAAGEPITCKP